MNNLSLKEAVKTLYIIKAGSTFADTASRYGDFEAMTIRGMGIEREHICVVNAAQGGELPLNR